MKAKSTTDKLITGTDERRSGPVNLCVPFVDARHASAEIGIVPVKTHITHNSNHGGSMGVGL